MSGIVTNTYLTRGENGGDPQNCAGGASSVSNKV